MTGPYTARSIKKEQFPTTKQIQKGNKYSCWRGKFSKLLPLKNMNTYTPTTTILLIPLLIYIEHIRCNETFLGDKGHNTMLCYQIAITTAYIVMFIYLRNELFHVKTPLSLVFVLIPNNLCMIYFVSALSQIFGTVMESRGYVTIVLENITIKEKWKKTEVIVSGTYGDKQYIYALSGADARHIGLTKEQKIDLAHVCYYPSSMRIYRLQPLALEDLIPLDSIFNTQHEDSSRL